MDSLGRCWMSGDTEVENATTIMCQHQEHVEDLKPDRRHREEVNGNHTLHMVLKERPPGLGRRLAAADQVLA